MKLIKIGAAVLNQLPLDWAGNKARILTAIEETRGDGVNVLCLPELCITGYGCEDAFHSPNPVHRAWKALKELLPATKGMIVSFGLPVLHQHGLFNCACLAVDGSIAGFTAKRFLAGDGIHYEPRWFKPWPNRFAATSPLKVKHSRWAASISTVVACGFVLRFARMRGWPTVRARHWR